MKNAIRHLMIRSKVAIKEGRYMPKRIQIGNHIYDRRYGFDGGTYFVSKTASWVDCWAAVMNDGSLRLLINGAHCETSKTYKVVG